MSLHPVMNDEVLLPNGIIPFLLYPFRYIKRTRIKKVAVTIGLYPAKRTMKKEASCCRMKEANYSRRLIV